MRRARGVAYDGSRSSRPSKASHVPARSLRRQYRESALRGRPARRVRAGAGPLRRAIGRLAPCRTSTRIDKVAPTAPPSSSPASRAAARRSSRGRFTNAARARAPFVAVNCGAIPANLIEAELFGYEKGAFTGAARMHRGCFERAEGGTLFLDEVTEMAPEMQVRLLRVLETGRFTRVGGERELRARVRVIAATNRDPHRRCATARCAKTSCTGSPCFRSRCRRCASAKATPSCWPSISCGS